MRGVERERQSQVVTVESSSHAADALSPCAESAPTTRHARRESASASAIAGGVNTSVNVKAAPRRAMHRGGKAGRAISAQSMEVKATDVRPSSRDDPSTASAIAAAWRAYKATGESAARDLLIIHYMSGHVRRIAHRMSAQLPKQIDPDDLVQHVYHGLVRLIDRFDPERDVQFETFSSRRLVGAMRDYLRDLDTSGRQSRQRAKRLQEIEGRFIARNGRRPDNDELQCLLGVEDADEFRKYIDDARTPMTVSFASGRNNRGRGGGGGMDGADDADGFGSFRDLRLPPPLMRLEREDLRRWLTEGLARRDRLIVILYYYEQMTMKEIGQTLGCSESRVSQRLDSILECLRARLNRAGAAGLE